MVFTTIPTTTTTTTSTTSTTTTTTTTTTSTTTTPFTTTSIIVPTTPAYINYCAINPCKNNALCTSVSNGYVCLCYPGFTGVNCEIL